MTTHHVTTTEPASVADTVAELLGSFVSATDMARRAVLANADDEFYDALMWLFETRLKTIEFARTRPAA